MRQRIPIYHSMTLNNCAEFLLDNKLDFDKKYYNIKLKGKITSEPIHAMIKLPYEITIYNYKGSNRLMTGTKYATSEENDVVYLLNRSIFNLHTHPPRKNIKFDAPSFADLMSNLPTKKRRAIAHVDGILIYGPCKRDIENNVLTLEDALDDEFLEEMVKKHLGKKQVSLFESLPNHKNIENVPLALQSKYQKDFANITGLIQHEASWDNKKEIEKIMKIIFEEYA